MMTAMRAAFDYRDFRLRPPISPAAAPVGARARWTTRMQRGGALDESKAWRCSPTTACPSCPTASSRARPQRRRRARLGFPAVLKTATPGILHKSDVGGVKLNLYDAAAIRAAYDDLARPWARVLVTPMAGKGVELAFGALDDPQFGPIVMAGAGGILIEIMADRRFALPPFDAATRAASSTA